MISKVKKVASIIKANAGSWSSNRKILVIESDDWGSIRIPNKEAFTNLKKGGIPADKCAFLSYDHLEQVQDFDALFSVMEKIHQKHRKSPKITANYIMANPDFKKIRDSGFKEYHYVSLKDKLKADGSFEDYMKQLQKGKQNNWFHPQLHGREHLNIGLWMRILQESSEETLLAFENEVYGISTTISSEKRRSYLPALDYENQEIYKNFVSPSLIDGHDLFKDLFGFSSKSFIAPNYTWDSKVEDLLADQNIEFIQSSRSQLISIGAQEKEGVLVKHKTGNKNRNNQIYLVRNAIFEPSTVVNKQQHLSDCIRQINLALQFNKPAILSMHRLNFMGGMDKTNRDENLMLFQTLIDSLLLKHPTIEFMSSDELGEIIKQSKT